MNESFSPGPHPVTLGSSERAEDKKACSDANTGVCDVERWPRVFVHVEMKKIGHRSTKNSIGQISKDTAGEQSERYFCEVTEPLLRFSSAGIPHQKEEDHRQRSHRQPDKKEIVSSEHAECGAGIRSVNQAEESGDDREFFTVRDILAHEPLRELVQGEERQCEKNQIFHSSMTSSPTTSAHRSQRVG
jgi:hypothetical protein